MGPRYGQSNCDVDLLDNTTPSIFDENGPAELRQRYLEVRQMRRNHPDEPGLEIVNLLVGRLPPRNARDGRQFARGRRVTRNGISGDLYGGFRPQACPIGAPASAHKRAQAVDRYDPHGLIDGWCMVHQDRLAWHGIWLEHPDATPGWSHWACVPPKSGNRVFRP